MRNTPETDLSKTPDPHTAIIVGPETPSITTIHTEHLAYLYKYEIYYYKYLI